MKNPVMVGQVFGQKLLRWEFLTIIFVWISDVLGQQSFPDATSESPLRPVSSFEDVSVFEFEVPLDTVLAHWEFAAFQDNQYCPAKKVLIYVKQGSYPAVLPGAPDNHKRADFNLTATADFENATAAVLRVASPRPGPWFAVAYMPDWDDEVGFRHKCRYSIGVVARWTRDTSVTPLVFGKEYHLETSTNFRRFRIFVDEFVTRVKLTVSNCTSILSLRRRSNLTDCLRNVVVLAEGPPFDAESQANAFSTGPISSAPKNVSLLISTGLGKSRAHYYMGVESEAVAHFTIKFEAVKVCEAEDGLSAAEVKPTDGVVGANCPIWRKLSRVSRPRDFETEFLFENRHGLTNKVDLLEDHPVLVTFELLPYLDIGGSLHVRLKFVADSRNSSDSNTSANLEDTSPLMVVKGFFAHDSNLDVSAAWAGQLKSNLTALSAEVKDFRRDGDYFLSIPYPRPGTYSLVLVLECYNSSDARQRVVCTGSADKLGVPVIVDVKTRMCSVPDWIHFTPCGPGGACREAHRRRWFFTYCDCYPGYSGWNCSKNSETGYDYTLRTTSSLLSPRWSIAFLTVSNAAFVPVVVLAARRHLWSAMCIYALMAFFSVVYHACDVAEKDDDFDTSHFCVLYFELLAFLDFLGSSSAIWITISGLANLPRSVKSAVDVVGVVVVAGAVHHSRTGLLPILLPLIVGALIVIFSHAWSEYRARKFTVRIRTVAFPGIGMLLAFVAFLLFAFVETSRNYAVVHSIWHVMIAIALLFLLPKTETMRFESSNERLATEMLEVHEAESSDDAWLIENCDEENANEDCDEEEESEGDADVNGRV